MENRDGVNLKKEDIHTALGFVSLIGLIFGGLALLTCPVKNEKIGEGNLVVLNGINLLDVPLTAQACWTGSGAIFVGLSQSEEVVFYRIGNCPDVLYPNIKYEVWRRYNIFGLNIGTYLEET